MSYILENSVLVVSDSELDSGDNKVVSSEVAEMGEWAGKPWGLDPVNRPWVAGGLGKRRKTDYYKL